MVHRIKDLSFVLGVMLSMAASTNSRSEEFPTNIQRVALYPTAQAAPHSPERLNPRAGDTPDLLLRIVESGVPTATVVVLPGGGYRGLAMSHEGYQIADWFETMGVSSVILRYRHGGLGNDGKGYGHPVPMTDAQRAIQMVRAHASDWNIDPNRVGIMGFSAGGHLASTVATTWLEPDSSAEDSVARHSSRPDFGILCYPVIGFGEPWTHVGSQTALLGKNADAEQLSRWSTQNRVSEKTPPIFLFHTGADQAVPARNSIEFYLACLKHKVPAEMHLFPEGRHGLGLAKSEEGASQWPSLCRDWLERIGVVRNVVPSNQNQVQPASPNASNTPAIIGD